MRTAMTIAGETTDGRPPVAVKGQRPSPVDSWLRTPALVQVSDSPRLDPTRFHEFLEVCSLHAYEPPESVSRKLAAINKAIKADPPTVTVVMLIRPGDPVKPPTRVHDGGLSAIGLGVRDSVATSFRP